MTIGIQLQLAASSAKRELINIYPDVCSSSSVQTTEIRTSEVRFLGRPKG
jgi:hypothetical protein